MSFLAILVLAVGLSMDAMAVSAARGLAVRRLQWRHAGLVAAFFGGFQALMPVLGFALGSWLGQVVEDWDHWIAFVLLLGVGLKMLHEAWEAAREARAQLADPERAARERPDDDALFGLRVMLVLAVATSIDAFAVGITLPLLGAPLLTSIATIGVTTALLSALGLLAGRRFGAMLGGRLDAFGGLALIALGAKILRDHLTAG
ncbi:MAG: manganese efflux pump MntP family protein [Anaeromyxobacter sp.]